MATDGSGTMGRLCVAIPVLSGHPSLSRSPPFHRHPQKEGTKKTPLQATRRTDRASVTMGAALWGPGRKPRVSIWGLLVHLLAVIAQHQLLPARGGIEEADLEPRAGTPWALGRALSPLGVSVSPTVD